MTAILFVSLLVCFVLGMPIAFSLGVASVTTLQYGSNLPLTLAAQRLFTGTDSFPLMAIPFFMLAGELIEKGCSVRLLMGGRTRDDILAVELMGVLGIEVRLSEWRAACATAAPQVRNQARSAVSGARIRGSSFQVPESRCPFNAIWT